MANRIVLISDDSDFFDYIVSKLELRKSDELFTFSFDAVPEKIYLLEAAVLIINSENSEEKTLDLLNFLKTPPKIIFSYNDDDIYRRKCYRAGAFDFMTILTQDAEFRARMIPALSVSSILEKNKQYRDILVKNNTLIPENEVFLDYNYVLDQELELLNNGSRKAVFAAIAPNDKNKFLLKPQVIEATILNNIRKNDILMNYAANKYFLLMFDIDVNTAEKIWLKFCNQFPEKVYAGFCNVSNQKRQQLINEALNKLHEAINQDKEVVSTNRNPVNTLDMIQGSNSPYSNFKMFRQEFGRKLEQVITPVFYQIQQKYTGKLVGVILEQGSGDGYGTFYIKDKYSSSCFRITSPGFSKINIDITYQKNANTVDAKRITLEPEELEAGLLEDLLEQFILEYKRGCEHDS